jgi:hypothetical protein
MTIRVALVPLTDDAGDEPALDAALAVLRRAGGGPGGHVRALHVRAQPSAAVFAGTPEGTMVTAEILTGEHPGERAARAGALRALARGRQLGEAAAPVQDLAPDQQSRRHGSSARASSTRWSVRRAGSPISWCWARPPSPPATAVLSLRRRAVRQPPPGPAGAARVAADGVRHRPDRWNGSAEAAAAVAAQRRCSRAKTVAASSPARRARSGAPHERSIICAARHRRDAAPGQGAVPQCRR